MNCSNLTDYSVTLVIDDCDDRDRASIWSALKGRSGIKLITIDHGPDETYDSAMRTYHCPPLADEQIKNILFGYLQQNADLHNWAGWCSGSPRVAHLVGENLKSNPDHVLKSPADVPSGIVLSSDIKKWTAGRPSNTGLSYAT